MWREGVSVGSRACHEAVMIHDMWGAPPLLMQLSLQFTTRQRVDGWLMQRPGSNYSGCQETGRHRILKLYAHFIIVIISPPSPSYDAPSDMRGAGGAVIT